MKGLTLTQPWATLMALGAKQIETRSWKTGYRGLVAIHAAKGFPTWCKNLWLDEPFAAALADISPKLIPRACVVAVGELFGIRPTNELLGHHPTPLSDQERAFGDYTSGRHAWLFRNVVPLPLPIPCKGALQMWEVPPAVAAAIRAQLPHYRVDSRSGSFTGQGATGATGVCTPHP